MGRSSHCGQSGINPARSGKSVRRDRIEVFAVLSGVAPTLLRERRTTHLVCHGGREVSPRKVFSAI